jgi:beta-glucosidase
VDFDDYRDAVIVDAGRTGGDAVTPAANQAARLVFRHVDLTGAATLTAEVSRTAPGPAGLDVYADGLLLAALPVDSTGDRYTWTTVSAALGHQHDTVSELTVVLTGEQRLVALTFAP